MGIQQESAELAAVVEETVAGRAGREGLRRRAGAGGAAAHEADDVYDARWRPPGCGPRFLPALELLPEHRPDRRARLRRPPGARRQPHPRRSWSRFNVYVVMLDLAAADARDDHRPGPARRRRRPSGSTRSSSPTPVIARQPARRPAARRGPAGRPRARCASRACASRLRAPSCRWCSTASTSPCRPGQSVALVGATGSGKTTVARLHPPLLRRRRRPRADRRRRRAATCASATCARPSASCSRTRSCSATAIAANIAFADPDAADGARSTRAARLAGAHEFIERPARGLRHADRRAGLLAVGRPAPAHRHRPGHPRRPPGADPRRRHLVGRPHQGARDPRRPRRGDARPHHDRHRPPAGHHRAGRPRRAARRRARRRRRHPRRRCSPRAPRYREVLAAAEARRARRRADGARSTPTVAGVD